jgi:hypothetical protein
VSGTAASPRFQRFEFLGSARFVQALATATVAAAAGSFALQRLLGWPGYLGVLVLLVLLAVAAMVARWRALDWRGILPISLIAFTSWCALSIVWSTYQWVTAAAAAYLVAFGVLGVFVAVSRDVIQIVRIVGDVLRVLLGVSLVLEVLSGIVLDIPISVLRMRGDILEGGPVVGIFGDGAHLGLVALVGAITFGVELVTRSVTTVVSVASIAGAVVLILLSLSGVALGAGAAVMVAALVLTGVRRVPPRFRPPVLWALVVAGAVALVFVLANLSDIIRAFQLSDQLINRRGLWNNIGIFAREYSLQGWGWIGRWRTDILPFSAFHGAMHGTPFASAFNTYLDVWFQVGIVGLALFVGLLGLVLVRSMHLAVRQPSIVYVWSPLVLVALIGMSITESALITEFAWLLLVVCVVKTANKMSWRNAFERVRPRETPPELPRA